MAWPSRWRLPPPWPPSCSPRFQLRPPPTGRRALGRRAAPGPGIVLGSLAASLACLPCSGGEWFLAVFFACSWPSFRLADAQQKPAPRQMPGTAGQLAAGGTVASCRAWWRGGSISVPFMVWCNVPIHQAVAAAPRLGFPIALANASALCAGGMGLAGLPPASLGYCGYRALA